ncbi:MAG: mechanosensitive ion channel [Planctomycetota bacterium]|nr:mechanosensitive ion channel [Planctomycetota bacterium]
MNFLPPLMLRQEAGPDAAAKVVGDPPSKNEGIDIEALLATVQENAIDWLINLAIAIAIYVIGKMVVRMIVRTVHKLLTRSGTDEILVNFLGSIASGVMMLFVIIAAIKQLGIDTSSMVALVGAAGLAIGFAMQDSLNNFASGVMLIVFRPFNNGDFVEAGGATGTVEKINIFSTIMKTGDNREIIVPNGAIFGGTITNYSARDTRRVDMVFGIGYDDDLLLAKSILNEIVAGDDRILAEPACAVAINDLGDSCVNFKVRPWVNSADYWDVMSDITEKVKLTFDEKGISIPYPQMDVHVHGQDA